MVAKCRPLIKDPLGGSFNKECKYNNMSRNRLMLMRAIHKMRETSNIAEEG